MAMNSIWFLLFLAVVCVVSYGVPRRFRYVWLLLCSVGFYLYDTESLTANLPALGLLGFAALVSYLCALLMQRWRDSKKRRLACLVVSIVACLGALVACKYLDFFALGLEQLLGLGGGEVRLPRLSLVLPLGISYYTLQTVSYAMDVYRGKYEAERNFGLYALYVSFFPGITTGPINRADRMLAQYRAPGRFEYGAVSGGLFRVVWGIFKKMVIADNIAMVTSTIFMEPAKFFGPHHAVAILLFAYQLYADFSGSCDIAIGAARMLGFTFMENFARPFEAKTYAELWRRWHISLTSFFRDYLYFPLGGNRVGRLRWVLNTLLVFVVSGLWHGASAGYLVWGALCGGVMVAARLAQPYKDRLAEAVPLYRKPVVRGIFQRVFVYLIFAGTFAFFAAALYKSPMGIWLGQLGQGWGALLRGALPGSFSPTGMTWPLALAIALSAVLVEVVEHFAARGGGNVSGWIRERRWFLRWPLYYVLILVLLAFGAFGQSMFIYQQY